VNLYFLVPPVRIPARRERKDLSIASKENLCLPLPSNKERGEIITEWTIPWERNQVEETEEEVKRVPVSHGKLLPG